MEGLQKSYVTFHCGSPKKIDFTKIDTSLGIGFYIKDYEDYQNFVFHIKEEEKRENNILKISDITPKLKIFDEETMEDFSYIDINKGNDSKPENIQQKRKDRKNKTNEFVMI